MIYLDYAATTPVAPEVAAAMAECLTADGCFGNPSSVHGLGRAANSRVEKARAQLALALNADEREIVFTSGATESDNMAILGVARFYAQRKGRHLVTSRVEHRAVVDAFKALEIEGFDVTWLEPVDGVVTAAQLAAALRSDTALVSLMHVNNELGVLHDIAALAEVCRNNGTLFHVDAAQSFGKLPIDWRDLAVDLLSISGHKIYGPKGIGALIVRRSPRAWLTPLQYGGGQEHGLRPGTLATHQIVGLGSAAELAQRRMAADSEHISGLSELFVRQLNITGLLLNGNQRRRLPNIVNFSIEGVHGEALLAGLPELAVATGSACSSAERQPSSVLRALGRSDELAEASLRISFGRDTTTEQVERAAAMIVTEVSRLRQLSPPRPYAA